MNNQRPLCIYHGGCDDGFGAAWAVRQALGVNVDFYPGVYQQEPPNVAGRDVIMVDFSYKRPVLDKMAAIARSILILDHHKTAAEDLADVPMAPAFNVWEPTPAGMWAIFDMNRSGAGLAWDYFHPGIGNRPPFINYIEDRDLWRKALPNGDEFTIALRSYPQDFAVWDELSTRTGELIEQGHTIQRYYRMRVEELKRHAYPTKLGGASCYISNAPYCIAVAATAVAPVTSPPPAQQQRSPEREAMIRATRAAAAELTRVGFPIDPWQAGEPVYQHDEEPPPPDAILEAEHGDATA